MQTSQVREQSAKTIRIHISDLVHTNL